MPSSLYTPLLLFYLQIFFSILEDSNGSMDASLVKKGLKFRDNLNQQFKWDFSVESEEYAPTVVD